MLTKKYREEVRQELRNLRNIVESQSLILEGFTGYSRTPVVGLVARVKELEENQKLLIEYFGLTKKTEKSKEKNYFINENVEKASESFEEALVTWPKKKHKKHNFMKNCPVCHKPCKGNLGLSIHTAYMHKTK